MGTDEHSRVIEVLAAKLVNFFHAEQRHAGRPLKARKQTAPKLAKVCDLVELALHQVVDLGCGRGTLVGG